MLKVSHFDNVIRFDLSRKIAGRGLYWTTAYYLDGLMVDSGCAFTAHELVQAMADKPLFFIVNTHSHEDHIGGNGHLVRKRRGLEIFAHPLALPILANPRFTQPLHPYRRILWGWPEPSTGKPVLDHELIETEHYKFRVIYTPGHSDDHICLYEIDRGWLFTGDLFIGGKDRSLRADYNIWQIIASLKKVARLPIITLFPGSAQVRCDPIEALNFKIAYLEDLGQRVLDLHKKGWEVKEIARALCGGPMLVEFITLGHFSRRHLVLSYLRRWPDEKRMVTDV
jgi:glyoxylase-like metal-dependent hydrolase (beta-lactamase superfamily II)